MIIPVYRTEKELKLLQRSYPKFDWKLLKGYKSNQVIGLFDSYVSALAAEMGLWEEYCEYYRKKLHKKRRR
jgi:hypothetical protein